jgi:aminoglycoside phosphotransferase (APT) family kinase protein
LSKLPPQPPRVKASVADTAFRAVVAAHIAGANFVEAIGLTGGVSADVYRLVIEEQGKPCRTVVIRIHGPNHNGHPAAFEFELLRALTGLPICAPRALALDESLRYIPHPFLILDHIDGEIAVLNDAADRRIVKMAKFLALIHSVPIPPLPLLPIRNDPLPELFDYLPLDREFDALRHGLSTIGNSPCAGVPALLHGDFWPGNLLWQGEDLVGILDWEDAACGDPLSDVACTALELRYVVGSDGAERFLQAYQGLKPLDRRRLALWQLYVASAAHHAMGSWGLDADREAHMRKTALTAIREASRLVI